MALLGGLGGSCVAVRSKVRAASVIGEVAVAVSESAGLLDDPVDGLGAAVAHSAVSK